MRIVEPVSRVRLDSGRKPDALKLTAERVIEDIHQFDPSFVVVLGKIDIPSFLYNSSGKLT
jgi:hypothetical protein